MGLNSVIDWLCEVDEQARSGVARRPGAEWGGNDRRILETSGDAAAAKYVRPVATAVVPPVTYLT